MFTNLIYTSLYYQKVTFSNNIIIIQYKLLNNNIIIINF